MLAQAIEAPGVRFYQEAARLLPPEPIAVRLLRRRDLERAGGAFQGRAGEALGEGSRVDEAERRAGVSMPRQTAPWRVPTFPQAESLEFERALHHHLPPCCKMLPPLTLHKSVPPMQDRPLGSDYS